MRRFILVQLALLPVLLEIALRIYNPFPFRVRGDEIVLPVNQVYRFDNGRSTKRDAVAIHTKNSLGFRGPEPPRDFDRHLTILAIGGSTTESLFLSDGRAWPDALARRLARDRPDVWVNNAGIDGHSTFGHLILIRTVVSRMRPKVALFLVGANDVGLEQSNTFDAGVIPAGGFGHAIQNVIVAHSEAANMALNLVRARRARERGFGHSELNLHDVEDFAQDDQVVERTMAEYRSHLSGYRQRLSDIVARCRKTGTDPVLITQPALFGDGVDPTTGLGLARLKVNGRGNGHLEWRLLEMYNDVTRSVAAADTVLLIDLARQMPKDSRYYYDFLHFSNEGSEKVAEIVTAGLTPYLRSRF